ncbi:conserved hypothetical protein [Neospora caninum Liverpool]|uniref:RNase NYN domain-containing protein n=1 Tax=Neospora caninum (strain Liverpool) TaxID=572307 RepID=F0V7E0_NEOCL|nr:conserved hypothetical protein [Neospora caninum Liverpool]CBZ49631.1 conserved hypothetical protein [Neospora caninum Liverpool]|eukprot:XP_003879666.1 conserved hypothetical protein [Neospora caninum Liverpool]
MRRRACRKNTVAVPFVESASGVINLAASVGDFSVACRVLLLLEKFNLLSPLPSSVGSAFVAAAAAAGEAEAASKMLQIMHIQGIEMRRKAFAAIVSLLLSRGQGFLVLKQSGLLRMMKEQRCLPLPAHLLALLLQDAQGVRNQLERERRAARLLVSLLETGLETKNGKDRQEERFHFAENVVRRSGKYGNGTRGPPPARPTPPGPHGVDGSLQEEAGNAFATALQEAEMRCRQEVQKSTVRLRELLDASREVLGLLQHVTEHEEPLASAPAIQFCNALRDLDLPVAHVSHAVLRHEEGGDANRLPCLPSPLFLSEPEDGAPATNGPPAAAALQSTGPSSQVTGDASAGSSGQYGTGPYTCTTDETYEGNVGDDDGDSPPGKTGVKPTDTSTAAIRSATLLDDQPRGAGHYPSPRPSPDACSSPHTKCSPSFDFDGANSHLWRERERDRKGFGQQPRRYGVCTACGVHLRRIPLSANERRLLRVGVLKLSAMLQPRQLRALLAFEVNLSRVQGLWPSSARQRTPARREESVEETLPGVSRGVGEDPGGGTVQARQTDEAEASGEREAHTATGSDPSERPRKTGSARGTPGPTGLTPAPSPLRPVEPRFTIVLDAANIAYNRQNREDGVFSYAQIECVRRELISRGERPLIILPAAYFWGVRPATAPGLPAEFRGQRRSKPFNSLSRESWFRPHVFETQSATSGGTAGDQWQAPAGEDPIACRRGLCPFCRDEIVVPNRCKPSRRRRRDLLGRVATSEAARALRGHHSRGAHAGEPQLLGVGQDHACGSEAEEAFGNPDRMREPAWRSHLSRFLFAADACTGVSSSDGVPFSPGVLTNRQRVTCRDRALLNQWEREGCLFVCGLGAHDDHYHLLASLNAPATEGLWRRRIRVSPQAQQKWSTEGEANQGRKRRKAVDDPQGSLVDIDGADAHVQEGDSGTHGPSVGEGSVPRPSNLLREGDGPLAAVAPFGRAAADFPGGARPAASETESASPRIPHSLSNAMHAAEPTVKHDHSLHTKREDGAEGGEQREGGKREGAKDLAPAEHRAFLGYVWDSEDCEGDSGAHTERFENGPASPLDMSRGLFPLSLLTNDRFRDHRLSSQQRIPFRHWRQLALLPYAFQWGLSPHDGELQLSPTPSPFSPPLSLNVPASKRHDRQRRRERQAGATGDGRWCPGRSQAKRRRVAVPKEQEEDLGHVRFADASYPRDDENSASDISASVGLPDYEARSHSPSSRGSLLADVYPQAPLSPFADGSEELVAPCHDSRVEEETGNLRSFTRGGDASETAAFLSGAHWSPSGSRVAQRAFAASQTTSTGYQVPSRILGRRRASPSALFALSSPHASPVDSSSGSRSRKREGTSHFGEHPFGEKDTTLPQEPSWVYGGTGLSLRSYPDGEEKPSSFQQTSQSFPLLFVGMTKHVTQRMQVSTQRAKRSLLSSQRGLTSDRVATSSSGDGCWGGDRPLIFQHITELLQEYRRREKAGITSAPLDGTEGHHGSERPSTGDPPSGTGSEEREESLIWHVPLREEDEEEGFPDFSDSSVGFRSRGSHGPLADTLKRGEEGTATPPETHSARREERGGTETERDTFPSFEGTSRVGGADGDLKGETPFPDTTHAVEWRHQEALERSRTWLGIDLTPLHELLREREDFLVNN